MRRLEKCIAENRANHSHAREIIYRVFLENRGTCLSVADIQKRVLESGQKKISINTIYRHLSLFIKCKLVVMVQDDYKKAYYALTEESPLAFLICRKCNRVVQYQSSVQNLINGLDSGDYITLHKQCEECSR